MNVRVEVNLGGNGLNSETLDSRFIAKSGTFLCCPVQERAGFRKEAIA